MGRVLVDASGLLALAKVGRLALLRRRYGRAFTTSLVVDEVAADETGTLQPIREALEDGWLATAEAEPPDEPRPGVDAGEASLLRAATTEDLLILDEQPARRVAQARGLRFTGILGLLVHAVRDGELGPEEGREALRRLARSDFHMTVGLLDWALERIDEAEAGIEGGRGDPRGRGP